MGSPIDDPTPNERWRIAPDDCPMTQECPAWDPAAQACLVAPDDCELRAPLDVAARPHAPADR